MNIMMNSPLWHMEAERAKRERLKYSSRPMGAKAPDYSENLFLEGYRLNAYSLLNEQGQVEGWRLKENQVNPEIESNGVKDFFYTESDKFGKSPFTACLEEFEKEEKIYAELVETIRRRA
jgi:hypothetical protein